MKIRIPLSYQLLISPLLFCVGLLVGFLLTIFIFSAYINPKIATKDYDKALTTIRSKIQDNANSSSLPIDPQAAAVKSATVQYQLVGRIQDIQVFRDIESTAYKIQIQSSSGDLLENTFWANSDDDILVMKSITGSQTVYSLSSLKKGDAIDINYIVDLKTKTQGKVININVY